MVAKMERGALSLTLAILLVLFLIQFFLGMAMNLLITLPTDVFPSGGGSLLDGVVYSAVGGNPLLTGHFIVDLAIIAVGIANLMLVIHKSNVYRGLSIASFIFVMVAAVNGARFVASNFTIDGISFGMAASYITAFVLYFAMAMLLYRDIAVTVRP